MAKREDFSQGVNSGEAGGSSGSGSLVPEATSIVIGTPEPAVLQLAQATTGGQQTSDPQIFDLANAPVKAKFTYTEPGTRVERVKGMTHRRSVGCASRTRATHRTAQHSD